MEHSKSLPGHPGNAGSSPTEQSTQLTGPAQAGTPSSTLRTTFGVALFLLWVFETFLWVASTVHEVAGGDIISLVTALCTLALLVVLGLMEGLEVSVIDRWQALWPEKSQEYLAGWLAARQLFVALIVTTATLLAKRHAVVIPGTSVHVTNVLVLSVLDLTWTGLIVLWFAQILPKHLGAMNPDRYLKRLRGPLFPVVDFVHKVGVSQPAEWTAEVIEERLDWAEGSEAAARRGPPGPLLGDIWRELRGPHRP